MNTSETQKYIGIVKWFYDKTRDSSYGFIQHARLNDLFFHESNIESGQDINNFRENAIVVFSARESKKYKGKIDAIHVKCLDTETDIHFLFNHFLSTLAEKGKYPEYKTIQKGVHSIISSFFEITTDQKLVEKLFESYQNHLNANLLTEAIEDEEYLRKLLIVCRSFFPTNYKQIADLIEEKISPEVAHKLWIDSFIEHCQIDFVANIILSATEQIKIKIFERCTAEEKSKIFFNILYNLENIDTGTKLKSIKELLKISKEFVAEQHEKILAATLNICPEYFKLNLWLEGYHEILDFNSFKLYTITLSPADQKKFVKKVLKNIHEGKSNISVEDLTSLNVIDFELNELAEQVDKSHLDYSTSVILNILSELQNQTKLVTWKETISAQHRIYDIVIKQIKEPKDILQITGYFDACGGRCSVSIHQEENEEGGVASRHITYSRDEFGTARNHPICDGRKAVNRETKEPLLSDEGVEYWWCANQKCFKPSRVLHNSTDWEKYSLLDFLTILKVDFKKNDLEIYLSIINKANRFLKHLKCRECNHILYPKGQTQYAFYGVNNFICRTESCSEKGKEIYLSHCLNGYCEMEIDSRDCVKCKPPGLDAESCGWYVCNFCHSCCSSEQLLNRKSVYENILHTNYNCHTVGHKDLGIVSCNRCGDSMDSNELNISEYQRFLDWFITNKDRSERIYKSGMNSIGKWWFLIKRGYDSYETFKEKLNRYYQVGFQIPDLEQNKDLQLISEPIDLNKRNRETLTCRNCGNVLDLSSDFEKAKVIKKFHKVRFV